MNGSEITLTTTPYFFSRGDINGSKIKYDWSMNGRNINNKKDARQATFRNTKDSSGSTKISVELQNENGGKELQSSRSSVFLNFEGNSSNKTVSF